MLQITDLNEYRCRRCPHIEFRRVEESRDEYNARCPKCRAFFVIIGKGISQYTARGFFKRGKKVVSINMHSHPSADLAYAAVLRALRDR